MDVLGIDPRLRGDKPAHLADSRPACRSYLVEKNFHKGASFCPDFLHLLLDITGGKDVESIKLGEFVIWACKRRVRVMRRRKESIGFVLILRMSVPLLFPSISALTV